MIGSDRDPAISFFGIKGSGTLYWLKDSEAILVCQRRNGIQMSLIIVKPVSIFRGQNTKNCQLWIESISNVIDGLEQLSYAACRIALSGNGNDDSIGRRESIYGEQTQRWLRVDQNKIIF